MKIKCNFLVVAISLITTTINCLSDVDYKACWNIELADENMFCYGAVSWQINTEIYYNAVEQDKKAKEMYRRLLFKWYNRVIPSKDHPNENCLAISRSLYCAIQFPRCKDSKPENQDMALCAFMCDLMLERCPEEVEDYEAYCSEKDYASSIDKYCSGALRVATSVGLGIISLFFYSY